MQAMRQIPTAMNPQTEFGEHLGFQQGEETTGWPHISHHRIPALSVGSMDGSPWGATHRAHGTDALGTAAVPAHRAEHHRMRPNTRL